MSKFNGKYEMQKCENLDEFLDKLGVGTAMKEVAKAFNPTIEVEIKDDVYIFRSVSSFKTSETKFKLNEEFEEERLSTDGKQVRSVVTKEGENKFVQTQYGPKEVTIVREFDKDQLTVTAKCDGSSCRFIYKKV